MPTCGCSTAAARRRDQGSWLTCTASRRRPRNRPKIDEEGVDQPLPHSDGFQRIHLCLLSMPMDRDSLASRSPRPRRAAAAVPAAAFGTLGLTGLARRSSRAPSRRTRWRPSPHFPARAKRVIFLFMHGGPSSSIPSTPSRPSTPTTASRCPSSSRSRSPRQDRRPDEVALEVPEPYGQSGLENCSSN